MKKLKSAHVTLFLLMMTFLLAFTPFRNSDFRNIDYSVSTNSFYFPGEEVVINLYSYNYRDKSESKSKADFNFEILKIKDVNEFYSRQTSGYGIDVLSKDSMNLLYLTEKVYSFQKSFKPANEYEYRYFNESIPLNVKAKGAYLVKVSSGNKVAYCGFIISELGIISKAGNNSMLAYVVERKSGNPVSDAEMSFFIGDKKLGTGNTKDGLLYQQVNNFENLPGDYKSQPMIIGRHNEDVVVSDPYFYFGYYSNRYYSYIFTEQPVYRTNSDVNFKGTIRKNTSSVFEPLANKELTVIIKDSKNAEVFKEVKRTNSNGSFDGTFHIDENAPLGEYYIYANIDENNSYSAGFTVEQYKKPEYKVTIKTDKSQYYGNDILTAEIDAKYFFGSPVANAEVEYNIYKTRYYKPWWSFSEYSWWYDDYYENQSDNQKYSGAEFIYSGSGKLDSEGKLEIEYKLSEEFKEDDNYDGWFRPYYILSDYRYIVQAKVTDKSRREISGTTTAFVTRGGFYLSANTDKYLYKPEDRVSIEVNAADFSDKPVQTEFEAVITKSTWMKDSREQKDYIKTLTGSTKSDGKGIVTFDIGNGNAEGAYSVEIKSKDERGNQIKTSAYFYVSKGDMWWYSNNSGSVQIIPDKDSYKKGEICRALILLTTPDVNALVTANTDDIIFYKTEKFKGTTQIVEIPVTEKYLSNFEINVNYVLDGTFYNGSKQVLVIPEEKFLTVQIEPSKLIYKPKEEGELKVRVTDNFGNPVSNAEVSLGIVDESIYSIKEDITKDIRKFFYGSRTSGVSTSYNTNNQSSGRSRLLTIFERFNLSSTSEKDLGTVRGTLLRKNGEGIDNAIIVIDEDFQAAVTDIDGSFEFKLPEGEYTVAAYYDGISKDDLVTLRIKKGQVKSITLYNDRDYNEQMGISKDAMSDNDRASLKSKTESNAPMKMAEEIQIEGKRNEISPDQSGMIMDGLITPDVRSDFRDAILWSPYAMTDASGYATVEVKYPDNLTTWRITSRVITEDTRVGQMTSTVITRKDLLIRMETPRFLQENDEVTISTIVHNYLSKEKQTKVRFSGENVSVQNSSQEKNLSIAPGKDVRLDWKIKVTEPVGEAKLYAEALTNEESDAVEIKIPLQPNGLKMFENTVADFSDEYKTESKFVNIPFSSDIRTADLRFTADPSLASAILSALDELAGYPYGCVEQTMSRFLPTVVVANAFIELNAPISEATQKDLPKMVSQGLQRLYGFQHSDGGWGWWENDNSQPFMTAYVVYGMSLAKKANYEVKEGVLKKGISAIKQQLKNSNLDETTRAYMLYSLAIADDKDEELFKREIDKIISADINDYARSLIAMTLKLTGNTQQAEKQLSDLEKNVKTTGEGAAYWEGKQFHYQWQDDKVQTTAMALKAIIDINSNSGLKDKVVRWLMMQRQGDAWRSTQETAVIIYAMVDYLKSSKELEPDYTVKIFVNGENVFDKRMTSESIFKKDKEIKIDNKILKSGANEIKIEKQGRGKLYFSANTNYYLAGDKISAGETGFRIEREYFKLEKYTSYSENKIVYRKKHFDGTVNSGDEILVKLKVSSKDENQYFMLEDALPSGSEVIKDDWAYTIEDENNFRGEAYYFWRWWYADKEVRDNRVSFFATYISKGEYEFSYIMKAQIPGDYIVNPAIAMLMYYPEYNGNTGELKLKIQDNR